MSSFLKFPEAVSIIPKYLYLLTHSITSLPSLKFSVISLLSLLKITTLVFFILTFKHQSLQYWCKISSLCWSPSALLEMRTKSSAYSSKDVISFPDKLTESSRSIFSRIFEKSFKKILKMFGLKTSPCLPHTSGVNGSVSLSLILTEMLLPLPYILHSTL